MARTALQIVQEVCRRTGQPVPGLLTASADAGVQELLGLLNEIGSEIAERYQWQCLTRRVHWTAPGTQLQGNVNTIFGANVEQINGATLWDSTEQKVLKGSLPYLDVQRLLNFTSLGVSPEYWIFNDQLFVAPAPAQTNQMNAFVRLNSWVRLSSGNLTNVLADDDAQTCFDDELMILGLKARWRRNKGLAYVEDLNDFENRLANKSAQDRPRQVLHLAGYEKFDRFVPNVPE
jgi:hypothetical protein